MNGKEARKLSEEEIGIELKRLRMKLFELHQQTVSEKVQNTMGFKNLRADIARLLTARNMSQDTA